MYAAGRTTTLVTAGLLIAACNSSPGGHPANSSAGIAGVRARAIAVCSANNHALAAAARQVFSSGRPTPTTWRSFMVKTGLPLIQQRFQQLAAMEPATFHTIDDAAEAALRTARQHPTILSPASPAPFEHVDALLAASGLRACAVGG